MADALARKGPLHGRSLASDADAAVTIASVPPRTRYIVRGRPAVAQASGAALGFPLPTQACRAATGGDKAALWLGPDEWLVIAPDGMADQLGPGLEQALSAIPHAIVDVSHRNTGLVVSGPHAAFVINHGCPLDLDLAAFPVGMCTRTLIGRTETVLWRIDETTFHIEVWRSFADYLVGFLEEARREFARDAG
jgi:sarcosine oxidase, subunit gamma